MARYRFSGPYSAAVAVDLDRGGALLWLGAERGDVAELDDDVAAFVRRDGSSGILERVPAETPTTVAISDERPVRLAGVHGAPPPPAMGGGLFR